MLVSFFNFNKRINSLKFPQNSEAVITGDVKLKAPTSLHSPTLLFACGESDMPLAMQCNYCSFNNHYYWITDTRMMSNSHIEFDCRIDVLSSYRNEILLTNAYIERSSSNGSSAIFDNAIDTRSDVRCTSKSSTLQIFSDTLVPTIGVINNQTSFGFLTYYQFTGSELGYFKERLTDKTFLQELSDYFSNPYQAIVDCKLLPIWKDGPLEDIYINDKILEVGTGTAQAHRISGVVEKHTYTIQVPKIYTDYRALSPISNYTLYMPYVGQVQLDDSKVAGVQTITIEVSIDVAAGGIVYGIYADVGESAYLIGTYSGTCSTSMAIAQVSHDYGSALQGAITIGSSFLLKGTGKAASIINSNNRIQGISMGSPMIINSFQQQTTVGGAVSSGASIGLAVNRQLVLECWAHRTSNNPEELTNVIGNPMSGTAIIGNLTGYVKTNNFSLSAAAHDEEIAEVNQLMDGGVYIE